MSLIDTHRARLFPALAVLLAAGGCTSEKTTYPAVGAIDGSEDEVVFQPGQVLSYRVRITQENLDWIEEHGIDEEWKPASLVVTGLEGGPLDLGQVGFRHKGGVGMLTGCWSGLTVPDDPSTPDVDEALLSRVRDLRGLLRPHLVQVQVRQVRQGKQAPRAQEAQHARDHAGFRPSCTTCSRTAWFYDFGVDASRTAPARLTIDVVDDAGQVLSSKFMGLFIAVEDVDDRYAKYHYVDADQGNLFKETWPNPAIAATWGEQAFVDGLTAQLETNTDAPDVSDFLGFTAAVAGATPDGFAEAMDPWFDMETILRYMAVDRAIGNWDGITAMYCWNEDCSLFGPHNMYWYHDTGAEGRFHLVPWDMDNTFQDFEPYLHPLYDWMAEKPVPDWNVKPASCAPIRVWEASHVAPPGCDRFLNLIASTQWARYDAIGRELIAGPLRADVLVRKAKTWTTLIEPILREDPYVDFESWHAEKERLVNEILPQAAARLADVLDEGYREE